MGFECGFSVVKRYNGYANLQDILNTYRYIEWLKNKEGFETYKEYIDFYKFEDRGVPSKELIEYYEDIKATDLCYWCSSGKTFDNYVVTHLHSIEDDIFPVTKEFLDEAMEWVNGELKEIELKNVVPVRSVKEDDNGNLIISSIDGIEVEDNNGKLISRTNCFDDGLYYTEDNERYWPLHTFKDNLDFMKSLKTLDVEGEFVIWYWRSY